MTLLLRVQGPGSRCAAILENSRARPYKERRLVQDLQTMTTGPLKDSPASQRPCMRPFVLNLAHNALGCLVLLAMLAGASSPASAAPSEPAAAREPGDPAAAPGPSEGSCDAHALQSIPERPAQAPGGSAFAARVHDLSGPPRDREVIAQILAGNLPGFLRRLVPVTVRDAHERHRELTVCVMPDYLAVGSDRDFVYVPMGLSAALEIAQRYGFVLPTPKLVDDIYRASAVKLEPQPLTPGAWMRSTAYLVYHSELIALQRAFDGASLGELTSGHKKDLVLTARLWQVPGRVAIYGWHRSVGDPIQPLSTVHGARYADYSHGVRLVSRTVYVDGRAQSMEATLADARLAALISREGVLPDLSGHLTRLLAQQPSAP